MKLNILAFGVHPDDVELGCAGLLINQIRNGEKVGIVDLTLGEMGTRGTSEIRLQEAAEAAKIIGSSIRENLQLSDCFFENDRTAKLKVIESIRNYQPEIVICNARTDRHPDHGRSNQLVEDACFLSGLIKIETQRNQINQTPWRPKLVLHYIQDRFIKPDIVVDVTDAWEARMASIMAHKSQLYNPDSDEPETYIASKAFFDNISARAMEFGRPCGFKYAEGFTCNRTIGVKNITKLY